MTVANSLFEQSYSHFAFPVALTLSSGQASFLYHWHDEIEILFVSTKTTTIGINDKPYCLNAGDIIIIGKRESHCVFPSESDSIRLALKFNLSLFANLNEADQAAGYFSAIKKHSSDWPPEAYRKIRTCIEEIYTEYTQKSAGYQIAILSQLYALLKIVARELPPKDDTDPEKKDARLGTFERTLQFLSENYLKDITLKDCADAVGFSMNYMSSYFKSNAGTTFHEYLTNIRINKAEWLLLNSQFPISEVMEQSGFSNAKTFNRVFKDRHGLSPREYRQRVKR